MTEITWKELLDKEMVKNNDSMDNLEHFVIRRPNPYNPDTQWDEYQDYYMELLACDMSDGGEYTDDIDLIDDIATLNIPLSDSNVDRCPFILTTTDYTYFTCEYDSRYSVASLPRDPSKITILRHF